MKLALKTLGCKVNRYESDRIAEKVRDLYEVVDFQKGADVYVINTCTVTHEADRKSRHVIKKIKHQNNDSKVLVFGCGVRNPHNRYGSISEIDGLFKNQDDVICYLRTEAVSAKKSAFHQSKKSLIKRTRALVKVQDGCNNFCSYCIIPFTRGRAVSYPLRRIINEVKSRVTEGYQEIVLTGINIGEWREGTLEFHYPVEDIRNQLVNVTLTEKNIVGIT